MDPHRGHHHSADTDHPRGSASAAAAEHRDTVSGHAQHDHAAMVLGYRRRFWVCLVLTVPVLLISPTGSGHAFGPIGLWAFPGSEWLLLALGSVIYFYGGWPFISGLRAELVKAQPGMMTLIALAISVAYFYSVAVVLGVEGDPLFWELATLIDIMLLGHWLEMKSVMGASGALRALVELLPKSAHRIAADGSLIDVPIAELQPGDRVLVKPGERIPADAVVVEGTSSIDESMLTGESRPVVRKPGDLVIGGAVNAEGAITIAVNRVGAQTYLSQVIDMVRKAQRSRSRTQDVANRAALWLTYIAIGVGLTTLFAWLVLGENFAFAMERMVAVMVISCPHALGLAVPLVVAVSTTLAARHGLLIRDRAAFERARKLNAVVFDKTGTLTEGRFGVTDVVAFDNVSEQELLGVAASLESQSEHPIARGIVEHTQQRGVAYERATDFRNLTGQGAQAMLGGERIAVVSPGYLAQHGLRAEDARLPALASAAKPWSTWCGASVCWAPSPWQT
jgi:Cu2+-exporting ATPase